MSRDATLQPKEWSSTTVKFHPNTSPVLASRAELEELVCKERGRTDLAERLPATIAGFLEAFGGLDIRQQKAHLQGILKAARIYRDGRIELEFRES